MLVPAEIRGVPVLIEAMPESGAQPTSRTRHAESVQDMFERAEKVIEQVAVSVVEIREKLASYAHAPDQVELQFGIKFTAKGNIVIAEAGVESSITVKVIYGNGIIKDSDSSDEN